MPANFAFQNAVPVTSICSQGREAHDCDLDQNQFHEAKKSPAFDKTAQAARPEEAHGFRKSGLMLRVGREAF